MTSLRQLRERSAQERLRDAAAAPSGNHPEDGAQDGLLAFGTAGGGDAVVALWADSWHQHPEAKVCEGINESGVISVGMEYGDGWRWQIVLDATKSDVLVLRMDNVIPPEVATE